MIKLISLFAAVGMFSGSTFLNVMFSAYFLTYMLKYVVNGNRYVKVKVMDTTNTEDFRFHSINPPQVFISFRKETICDVLTQSGV